MGLAAFISLQRCPATVHDAANAEDELDRMRAIMASIRTEISSHKRWKVKKLDTEEAKISFCLTRPMRDAKNGNMANAEELFGLNEPCDR